MPVDRKGFILSSLERGQGRLGWDGVKGSIKEEPPRPDWRIEVDKSSLDNRLLLGRIPNTALHYSVPVGVFGSGF